MSCEREIDRLSDRRQDMFPTGRERKTVVARECFPTLWPKCFYCGSGRKRCIYQPKLDSLSWTKERCSASTWTTFDICAASASGRHPAWWRHVKGNNSWLVELRPNQNSVRIHRLLNRRLKLTLFIYLVGPVTMAAMFIFIKCWALNQQRNIKIWSFLLFY